MDRVDFRSDTVTWPTPTMRKAMANAPIGDDVYGEDPTVNHLEALAASKTGMEAGLFVSSGTMGNLTAVLSHTNRGGQAIVGKDAHVFVDEAGGMAMFAGVMPNPLPTDEYGRISISAIQNAVSPDDIHNPPTELILVENSYGARAGYPIAPDYFADVRAIAQEHNLKVHMDGARLFNTAVALNIPVTEITQHLDSVTFCLSKGLCAPVGSVLCGSGTFIQRARRARKALGGGMRQAGILAAAGIVALNEMIERLAEDHKHACQLAMSLAEIPGIEVNPETVRTNMVYFNLAADLPVTPKDLVTRLREENIWINGSTSRFRAVTHYWIGEKEVEQFVNCVRNIVSRA